MTPVVPTAAPVAKNGRAKAMASSTSAVMRSARSRSSRRRRLSVCSTGACLMRCTAANFTRVSGSRFSKWSTIGTAAAAAPARNRGERNESTTATSTLWRGTTTARFRAADSCRRAGSRCRWRRARGGTVRSVRRYPSSSAPGRRQGPP